MSVQAGQYWIVENDSVALTNQRNGDNSAWLVNRIDSKGNIITGVGVVDEMFKRKISQEEARRITTRYVQHKVNAILNLS